MTTNLILRFIVVKRTYAVNMVLLRAVIRIVCPKTGKEVELHKECQDADGKGTPCQYYKHFGLEGHKVYVACASTKAQ